MMKRLNIKTGVGDVSCELVDKGEFYLFYVDGVSKTKISKDYGIMLDDVFRMLCSAVARSFEVGYVDGYDEGSSVGYNRGHNDGYNTGYSRGHDDGYGKGHDDGYSKGHSDGYDEGHDDGSIYLRV